ncbi:MAG: lamin tail domain-containing protein [Bacteroidales bacterium]|nr:lamin tail domain-containing protein [Bacteroidales bacterium]
MAILYFLLPERSERKKKEETKINDMTMKYFILFLLALFTIQVSSQETPRYRVLITEIFYDPSPVVGLPDCEFVELYNNSTDSINLKGWQWQVGEKSVDFSSAVIPQGECAILTRKSAATMFNVRVIGMAKWLSLANSGQYVVLKDQKGDIVHFANYSPAQFGDKLKRNGGWSLELTCLDRPCDPDSWQVSEQVEGGSPGFLTSENCRPKPHERFEACGCGYFSASELLIFFSRPLLPATKTNDLSIFTEGERILSWSFYKSRCDQISVELPFSMLPEEQYTINVKGSVIDCNRQVLGAGSLIFGRPEDPDSGDVVITEILFDQDENGLEFIEVYNTTGYVYDLNRFIVATLDDSGWVKDFSRSGDLSFLLLPESYAVMCSDKTWFMQRYQAAPVGCVHQRRNMPALSNNGGGIRLMDERQHIIDEVRYDPDWHDDRLAELSGVSLERMDYQASGMQAANWYSAAASRGYATPGEENSQRLYPAGDQYDKFVLVNELVSPDLDGNDDLAVVKVRMGEPGFTGRFEVRTPSGFLIRLVQDWGLLPVIGQLSWDGFDEYQHRVSPGIYILIINYADRGGRMRRWKRACGISY